MIDGFINDEEAVMGFAVIVKFDWRVLAVVRLDVLSDGSVGRCIYCSRHSRDSFVELLQNGIIHVIVDQRNSLLGTANEKSWFYIFCRQRQLVPKRNALNSRLAHCF